MNSTLRKREILALLEQHGSVQVGDLANRMGVSKVTIRNDLDALATLGSLVRTHGGAITAENKGSSRYISNTIHEFRKEKSDSQCAAFHQRRAIDHHRQRFDHDAYRLPPGRPPRYRRHEQSAGHEG